MNLKKLCALALAALMLLSLWACGKKDDPQQQWQQMEQDAVAPDEEVFVEQAAGRVYLHAGGHIQISYDAEGNVLAVVGENDIGLKADAAYGDPTGKPCAQVVKELIDLLITQNSSSIQNFVLVRQELGSANPAEDFMQKIETEAAANSKSYPVFAVAADDCDTDGCFSANVAEAMLKLAIPATADLTLVCSGTPSALVYTILGTDSNKVTTNYLVDALTGQVSIAQTDDGQETFEEFVDTEEDEPIPESDVFDYVPDEDGTDGGVDNGSVDFD